jgi:DNA-binding CsgD family transcriptional regulator
MHAKQLCYCMHPVSYPSSIRPRVNAATTRERAQSQARAGRLGPHRPASLQTRCSTKNNSRLRRPPARNPGRLKLRRAASGVGGSRDEQSLLERDGELSLLDAALGAAERGDGRLVVVHGPAGIGKTALVATSRRLAQDREMLVLSARGEQIEGGFAFGVARQLLAREAHRRLDTGKLEDADRLAAVALGIADQDAQAPPPADPCSSRHGLYWLTSDLTRERPALLAIDDAQWADSPSLEWLAFLARRIDDLPVALVVAVRDEDEPGPTLAALRADPSALTILPGALTPTAVERIAAEALGQDAGSELAQEIYRVTEGNPLWVNELVRALGVGGGPVIDDRGTRAAVTNGSVTQAVLARLGQLTAGAVTLAGAVAILGSGVDPTDAVAVAGLGGLAADRAGRALVHAGLLVSEEGTLSFGHPVVRDAVYADLGPDRRAAFHQAAARVLSVHGAGAEEVAAHLLRVPPGGGREVIGPLREAADLALARGAPEIAVDYLERALAEETAEQHASIVHTLGTAEARLNRPAAVEHLLTAYSEAHPTARAKIAIEAAHSLFLAMRLDEAVELLEQALVEGASADRETRLRIHAELVGARIFGGELSDLPDPPLEGKTPGERALLSTLSLVRLAAAEPVGEARRMARTAWADGQLLSEEGPDSTYVQFAYTAIVLSDSYAEAIRWLDELLSAAQRRGSVVAYVLALAIRAYTRFREGAVDEAVADARLAMAAEAEHPTSMVTPFSVGFLIEAMIEVGQLQEADEALRTRGLDGPLPSIFALDVLLDRRGRLRIAQGRLEEGVDDMLEAGRRMQWRPNPVENWRSYVASALVELDRGEEARSLVANELELAQRVGAPRQIAIAERTAALLQEPVDLERLGRSAEMAAAAGARLEQARALTDLGAGVRRAGERVRAREILHVALDLATRCGASVLAERAREELRAAGGRVRRVPLKGPGSLTPCERRVARMAADGLSNREIAGALFLAPRTIETHLSHVYTKLEIASRAELPCALDPPVDVDKEA